jgi:CRP/FNR family transcriptional regulator, cyclic AMP receptor protein
MPGKDDVVSLLSRTELFAGLPSDDLTACATAFREAHFAKGKVLFVRGDVGRKLFLVVEGRVRLAVHSDEGRELAFRHATAGDLFGEIATLDGDLRTADATAITPVTAYTLDQNAFRSLWSSRSTISDQLIRFLCKRLRETSTQLESIALYPLHVRLARFLLVALANRKPPPGKRLPLDLGFSQSELAMLLGASRPKVNEALGMLETAGALGRTQDRMFCDPDKLAAIAEQAND